MANWQAYRAMKAKAEEVGWPRAFPTDLTKHDRMLLARKDAPAEFVWVLRECGTHLLRLGKPFSLTWAGPLRDPSYRWFVYRDGLLLEVGRATAIEVLVTSLRGQDVYSKCGNVAGTFVDVDTVRERLYVIFAGHKGRQHRYPFDVDRKGRLSYTY